MSTTDFNQNPHCPTCDLLPIYGRPGGRKGRHLERPSDSRRRCGGHAWRRLLTRQPRRLAAPASARLPLRPCAHPAWDLCARCASASTLPPHGLKSALSLPSAGAIQSCGCATPVHSVVSAEAAGRTRWGCHVHRATCQAPRNDGGAGSGPGSGGYGHRRRGRRGQRLEDRRNHQCYRQWSGAGIRSLALIRVIEDTRPPLAGLKPRLAQVHVNLRSDMDIDSSFISQPWCRQ